MKTLLLKICGLIVLHSAACLDQHHACSSVSDLIYPYLLFPVSENPAPLWSLDLPLWPKSLPGAVLRCLRCLSLPLALAPQFALQKMWHRDSTRLALNIIYIHGFTTEFNVNSQNSQTIDDTEMRYKTN